MDSIECKDIRINDIKIDFGEIDPNERVNGLIGLDFLRKAGVMLDLVDLVMYKKSKIIINLNCIYNYSARAIIIPNVVSSRNNTKVSMNNVNML